MCFFRKKIYEKQREIAASLEELKSRGDSNLIEKIESNRQSVVTAINVGMSSVTLNIKEIVGNNTENIKSMKEDVRRDLTDIRLNVEKNLKDVRADNEKQLNEIRGMVEEKLTKSLAERLNQTFSTINERLDSVNKGLGELQVLNNGVTDLKKVLSNVKTRGVLGEISLENILENIFTKEQYCRQCAVKKGGAERVDFAVILPGKEKNKKLYLPIDVKFPMENYQKFLEHSEKGDKNSAETAQKELMRDIKFQAGEIRKKYINPPDTTDFAVMYLPTEGLYAEVAREAGLLEELTSKYKIIPAGPSTVTALLNSLQIGFRTLEIQKSSRDVCDLLTSFKKDFEKFVDNIEKARKEADKVSEALENVGKGYGKIQKKLEKAEALRMENIMESRSVAAADDEG